MSDYTQGTVDVTPGLTTVTGHNTAWTLGTPPNARKGDDFVRDGDGVTYKIVSVTQLDPTTDELELATAYAGAAGTGVSYAIVQNTQAAPGDTTGNRTGSGPPGPQGIGGTSTISETEQVPAGTPAAFVDQPGSTPENRDYKAQIPAGFDGEDGVDGNTLLETTANPPADTFGNDGDFAINNAEQLMFGPKAGGTWPPGYPIAGEDGATWIGLPRAPLDTDGNDGDFFMDTAALFWYGPKAGGTWPTPGNAMQGVQGIPGESGLPLYPTVITAATNLVTNYEYRVDTSGGSFEVTITGDTSEATKIGFIDATGFWSQNYLYVRDEANTFRGYETPLVLDLAQLSVIMRQIEPGRGSGQQGWVLQSMTILGATGPGVQPGGNVDQFLRKRSGQNFDTHWTDLLVADVAGLQAALDEKLAIANALEGFRIQIRQQGDTLTWSLGATVTYKGLWLFTDSNTPPPGDGNVANDTAQVDQSTEIYVSRLDKDGTDKDFELSVISVGDTLVWTNVDDSKVGIFQVTGPAVPVDDPPGGALDPDYYTIPVQWAYGKGDKPGNGETIELTWIPQSQLTAVPPGGAVGQFLGKASAADYDGAWQWPTQLTAADGTPAIEVVAPGQVETYAFVDGRDIEADGAKLDTIEDFATNQATEVVLSAETATGLTGPEDGADTWAKIAEIQNVSQTNFRDLSAVIAMTTTDSGGGSQALVHIYARWDDISIAGAVDNSKMWVAPLSGISIRQDGFKLVSDGFGNVVEVWMKKIRNYCTFQYYLLSVARNDTEIAFFNGAPWQSAEPVGLEHNYTSQTAFNAGDIVTLQNGGGLSASDSFAAVDATDNQLKEWSIQALQNYMQANLNFTGEGTIAVNPVIQTEAFTAVAGNVYLIDTSAGNFVATMPANPGPADLVGFWDVAKNWEQQSFTVARNGELFDGQDEDFLGTHSKLLVIFGFTTSANGWDLYGSNAL